MKKLLPLFALVCLVANAGKTIYNPQIAVVGCTTLVGDGNCDSTKSFSLHLTGLDPHKLYIVNATDGVIDFVPGGVTLNPDTTTFDIDPVQVPSPQLGDPPAVWTFQVIQVNHNGTPMAFFGSTSSTFEYPTPPIL